MTILPQTEPADMVLNPECELRPRHWSRSKLLEVTRGVGRNWKSCKVQRGFPSGFEIKFAKNSKPPFAPTL